MVVLNNLTIYFIPNAISKLLNLYFIILDQVMLKSKFNLEAICKQETTKIVEKLLKLIYQKTKMNVQTDQSDEEISGDNDGLSDNPQSSGPSQSLTSKTSIV